MQCGAKCFVVQIERAGKLETVEVKAKTVVAARKAVRVEFDDLERVVSVREGKLEQGLDRDS